MKRLFLLIALGLAPSIASAQPTGPLPEGHPPLGPAEVIERVQQARQQRELAPAIDPHAVDPHAVDAHAVDPGGDGAPAADPHAGTGAPALDPAMMRRALGQGPAASSARADPTIPRGTVRVRVLTEAGDPVPGAEVRLGIIRSAGTRDARSETTGADGATTFTGLETGSGTSYRPSIVHERAQYGAPPFQLPQDRGYDVVIRQYPTTQESRVVLQYAGETRLEFVEDRLRVVQFSQLMNPSGRTYVFPADGLLFRLPPGFSGFQSREVMTDQRFTEDEEGFRLHGSIPPGRVELVWAFDLPIRGERVSFETAVPWRTMMYNVGVEATEQMELDVSGMPPAQVLHRDGARLLVTSVERRPGDPPLERVAVTIRGIPTPGPFRWLALGGALVLVLAGLLLAKQGGGRAAWAAQALGERKKELLDEAAELEAMFGRSEVGPKFRARRMEEIVSELAALLQQEAAGRGPR